MNKKLYLVLTIMALAFLLSLTACGGQSNSGSTATPTPVSPAPGGGEVTKDVTVTAKNFEFNPLDINLKVGDTVKLTLKNESGVHGLEIPDLKLNLKGGESAVFTVDKAGTYDFHCSIQCGSGHNKMLGKITVS